MLTKEKILGCYWVLVLGDALGMPVEFQSIEPIREIYGENGILKPEENAVWTDDTEMKNIHTGKNYTFNYINLYGLS